METTRPSLLIRVKNHEDQVAWNEFDGIYRPMLVQFATARGLDSAAAEELAQECMTAVHRYIGGFDYDPKKGRFKSWLRTMVNNRFRNMLRDRKEAQPATRDFDGLEDKGQSPDELFDLVWEQEHLKHCLRLVRGEVEETTFNAFFAHVIEDKSVTDVCRAFDMTENQVRTIKYRMTRRIQQRMEDLLGKED